MFTTILLSSGFVANAQKQNNRFYELSTDKSKTAYPVSVLKIKSSDSILTSQIIKNVLPEKNSKIYYQTKEGKQYVLLTDSVIIKELSREILWLDYQNGLLLTRNDSNEYGLMHADGKMLVEFQNINGKTYSRIEDFNTEGISSTTSTQNNKQYKVLLDQNGIICEFNLADAAHSKHLKTDSILSVGSNKYGFYVYQTAPTIYRTLEGKMLVLGPNAYIPPVYDSITEGRAKKYWKWIKTPNHCFRKVRSITYKCTAGEEKVKIVIALSQD